MVNQLLEKSADVNAAPAENGRTALQAASGSGHPVVVERFHRAGADDDDDSLIVCDPIGS